MRSETLDKAGSPTIRRTLPTNRAGGLSDDCKSGSTLDTTIPSSAPLVYRRHPRKRKWSHPLGRDVAGTRTVDDSVDGRGRMERGNDGRDSEEDRASVQGKMWG